MDEGRLYDGLEFDASLRPAVRDGEEIVFTRTERALLGCFIDNPGRLLTRDRLLDAMPGEGAGVIDRNIDFVIHRLRAKLGDPARKPRFIATRYGEGYEWIATPASDPIASGFLLIGPCFGMSDAGTAARALPLARTLAAELDRLSGADRRVVLRPAHRPAPGGSGFGYRLEISFHAREEVLHVALILSNGATGQVLRTFRHTVPDANMAGPVAGLAADIRDAIWSIEALPARLAAHRDAPLEVRLHDAAQMVVQSPESWATSAAQIAAARQQRPDDPALGLSAAMALYARLLQQVGPGRIPTPAQWAMTEDEMEALALGALPAIDQHPLLALGVAKMLFFVDRGHFELAERLAEAAFERSTAFAAAFATLGQFRMCRGDFDEAMRLYDGGIELSPPGSAFHIYLAVLKCTAMLAAGNRPALAQAADALYAVAPSTRLRLGLFLAPPDSDDLPTELEAVAAALTAPYAHDLTFYHYQVSARHFRQAGHRRNVMGGLMRFAQRIYGADAVPPAIARQLAAQPAG